MTSTHNFAEKAVKRNQQKREWSRYERFADKVYGALTDAAQGDILSADAADKLEYVQAISPVGNRQFDRFFARSADAADLLLLKMDDSVEAALARKSLNVSDLKKTPFMAEDSTIDLSILINMATQYRRETSVEKE